MTVKQLIKLLEKEDQNRLVILSSDGEGNNHSPLSDGFHRCKYRADSTWSGEIGLEKLTKELEDAGYSEEDVISDGKPALVLYPIN